MQHVNIWSRIEKKWGDAILSMPICYSEISDFHSKYCTLMCQKWRQILHSNVPVGPNGPGEAVLLVTQLNAVGQVSLIAIKLTFRIFDVVKLKSNFVLKWHSVLVYHYEGHYRGHFLDHYWGH